MTGYGLEYILDSLTLDVVMMIYDYGIGFEKTKSIILLNTYAEAVSGKYSKPKIDVDKLPPKYDQLKSMFGDRVKPIINDNEKI
jgi:hypothetical protein